jgi:TPP-dependent indolepyruvate ferredoxin oxidoreductase alpha subunit
MSEKKLADFSFGDAVIVHPEPERFSRHEDISAVLDGTHPMIGIKGIVDHIDKRANVIYVLLNNGQLDIFGLSEVEKIKKKNS